MSEPEILQSDREAARKIVVDVIGMKPGGSIAKMYLSGEVDKTDHVQIALRALATQREAYEARIAALEARIDFLESINSAHPEPTEDLRRVVRMSLENDAALAKQALAGKDG